MIRTFLIADIRSYTRFTAQHGDEAASRLARRFAQVATEGVEAWGGELVELRGDEALAVFESARQAPQSAGLLIMTADAEELQQVLRSSLTRGFTDTECATYAISPCPTLEEMRGG